MGIFFSASDDRTIYDVGKGAGWVGNQLKSVGSSVGRFMAKGAVFDATQSALQLTRNSVSKTLQKTKNFVRKKPNITSTPSLNRNRNQNKFKVTNNPIKISSNNPEIISGNNAGQTNTRQKKSGNIAGNNAGQKKFGNNVGNNSNISETIPPLTTAGGSRKKSKKLNNISETILPPLKTAGGSHKKSKKLFS
jgi:hypothetical protein